MKMRYINYLHMIPYTYQWILKHAIGINVKTILDLGCGDGFLMQLLSSGENWKITGVEIYPNAFKSAKESGVYRKVFNGSITKLDKSILYQKYDVVFCSQVIEHLGKKDVKKMLKLWEEITKKRIVITTTNGFCPYEPIENTKSENNPFQKHHSGWNTNYFIEKGFKVRGQGIKFVYGEKGLARHFPFLLPFWSLVGYVFAPLIYYFPKFGKYIICWKDV